MVSQATLAPEDEAHINQIHTNSAEYNWLDVLVDYSNFWKTHVHLCEWSSE
jgi:hypothetical protein